jgi:hypothetical protein
LKDKVGKRNYALRVFGSKVAQISILVEVMIMLNLVSVDCHKAV